MRPLEIIISMNGGLIVWPDRKLASWQVASGKW